MLPGPSSRVAGLEDEASIGPQCASNGPQRTADLLVIDEDLEGVPGHHDEIELVGPRRRLERAEVPLDVGAHAGLVQHRVGRIQPAEPATVPCLSRQAKQFAGPAPDVEDGVSRQHQRQVEGEVGAPLARCVVEPRQLGLLEQPVRHRAIVPGPQEPSVADPIGFHHAPW